MNDTGNSSLLISLGILFLVIGVLLLIGSGLAFFGTIPGKALYYFLGAVVCGVLHYIFLSLGGQIAGGLR